MSDNAMLALMFQSALCLCLLVALLALVAKALDQHHERKMQSLKNEEKRLEYARLRLQKPHEDLPIQPEMMIIQKGYKND